MSGIQALIGRHPIVTYTMAGLMLLSFVFVLAGEGSESAEALEAARTFYEQNAEVEVSRRNRHLLGHDFVDVVSHAYELQKDQGAGPIFFSNRMAARTQLKFEALADEAFATRMADFLAWRFGVGHEGTPAPNYVLHAFAHETLIALLISLIFLVVAGIGLEAAWGSVVFGGFCLVGIVLPAVAFRFVDAEGGVPLSGATGLVAAVLAAYAVRGLGGGFKVPGWLLLPVWLFIEILFVRDIWIDSVQSAPIATLGAGTSVGILLALSMKLFKLEKKIVDLTDPSGAPTRHPALDQAERAAEAGNPESALEALRKAHAELPRDREVALAYWNLARDHGDASDAVSAIIPILRDCVRSGESTRAIEYWNEITTFVQDVEVEPALVIRIGESLLDESQPEAALDALRRAVEHPRGLGTVLAQRVIRVARDLDPELTHRAAAIALEDSSLDDATREKLEMLVDEVRAKAPPPRKPAKAPASAPKAVEKTRPPLDSDIDLGHTSELTDPVEFARLNLQTVAVGSQLEPELDGIDPNALSVSSLEKEFSGDLGLEEGDELTDPDAREWNDPSLVENLDQTSDQSDALFDNGGLDGAPDDESVATASAQSVPAEDEPAVDAEGAALAPLDTRSKVESDTSGVARLGRGSGEGAEPSRSEELPAEALPGLGASPDLEDLERFEPSQDEMDSLAAPAPAPATAQTAPTPPTPTAPPTPPAAPSSGSAVVVPPPSVGRDRTEVVDIAADGGLRRLKVVQGVPVGVKPDALEIEVEGRGSSSVPFARIDAVAVAAVAGLSAKPVLVIDLVLNWLDASDKSLKVIRLQSNRFDPVRLVGSASSPLEALQRLVEGVLKRSGGTPLPDAAAVSGNPYTNYPDIAAYQRQVLCAEE